MDKYTAKYIPWELKLCIPISLFRADAMAVEKYIKRQKSRKFIQKLIENKDDLAFIVQALRVPPGRD